MRRGWIGLAAGLAMLALGGTALAQSQTTGEAKAPYAGSYLKRATLIVSDLERSLTIYRDLLGFDATPVWEMSGNSYSYTVFNVDKAAKLRGAMLSAGDTQVRTLALFEVTGQPLAVPQSPRVAAVVIDARGRLAQVMRAVKAMGLESFPTRDLKTPEGATGTEWGFVDPDGHLVVLYELNQPDTPSPR